MENSFDLKGEKVYYIYNGNACETAPCYFSKNWLDNQEKCSYIIIHTKAGKKRSKQLILTERDVQRLKGVLRQ